MLYTDHLSPNVVDGADSACVVQNTLRECRLPTVDVGGNTDVSCFRDVTS